MPLIRHAQSGDTIIEVMIAIAIASFAIGTSYSLANKSLQSAITASDRNQAVNVAQNQISALKIRHSHYNTEDEFNAVFGASSAVSGPPFPAHSNGYCLVEGPVVYGSPDWDPKNNTSVVTESDTFDTSKYNTASCVSGGQYYVNIFAEVTSTSNTVPSNRTVFKVTVTWPTVGSNQNSQATIYYRF